MIRTLDVAADLSIEVRVSEGRRHVALVDPGTREELLIAEDLQDSAIDDINRAIWKKLDKIATTLKNDPELSMRDGASVTREILVIGIGALDGLIKNSQFEIEDVQKFCSRRIRKSATSPPIIDVVARTYDNIFFEVMPLLGSVIDFAAGDIEAADLITGFNAIVRHRSWGEQRVGAIDDLSRISIRFFQHAALQGSQYELKRLRDLENRGKARIVLQYPPRGFHPDRSRPENELASVLANPRFLDAAGAAEGPGSICHLSCHLKKTEEGAVLELRPYGTFARPTPYDIDKISSEFHLVQKYLPHAKLCFVSACKSAAVERDALTSAMHAFRGFSPESIVGTLGSIPDITAATFDLRFYELLGEGWSVGAALWQAKRSLLEAPFHNPLGLLFVSYCGEDVQFALPSDRRQRFVPDEVSAIQSAPTGGL